MTPFFQKNPETVKLAYLSFDEWNNPYLNIQNRDEIVVWSIPISSGHLANIVADGAAALANLARTKGPFVSQCGKDLSDG